MVGALIGMSGLAVLALHQSVHWMFLGVSLMSAGKGILITVMSFLAASSSPSRLSATMGWLAVASGIGQTLGSAAGGWILTGPGPSGFAWYMPALLLVLLLPFTVKSWKRPHHDSPKFKRGESGRMPVV